MSYENDKLGIYTQQEKVRARGLVKYHLSTGRLKKEPCDVCGTTKAIEAHHPIYAEPLTVLWLCRNHHFELHKAIRSEIKNTALFSDRTPF